MKKLALWLAVLAAILLPALYAAPAHAAVVLHSYVSRLGSDLNSCIEVAPCRTFSEALAQTVDGGQVSCLDSGNFGAFTVTISVTIDCTGTVTTAINDFLFCTPGSVVNAPGRYVILRGLDVTGYIDGCSPTDGITIVAATAVYIEDCVIHDWPGRGILDVRTTGATALAIKNTIVHNTPNAGIVVAAASKNSVVLENVHSFGNGFGIAVAIGNNVVISRSVMSGNAIAGVEADPGAQVIVDNTVISHNASYGVLALGTVTLANSDISFNTSSINGSALSYGNNRLFGNGAGNAPTLISQQ
jgi:hypothetical protein